jgi:hypothetical protein
MFDSKKFRFTELFTNQNGKNSASGFCGLFIIIFGIFFFGITMLGYWKQIPNTLQVMSNVVIFIGIGGTLLGVRKVSGNFIKTNENNENTNNRNSEIVETTNKG